MFASVPFRFHSLLFDICYSVLASHSSLPCFVFLRSLPLCFTPVRSLLPCFISEFCFSTSSLFDLSSFASTSFGLPFSSRSFQSSYLCFTFGQYLLLSVTSIQALPSFFPRFYSLLLCFSSIFYFFSIFFNLNLFASSTSFRSLLLCFTPARSWVRFYWVFASLLHPCSGFPPYRISFGLCFFTSRLCFLASPV